MQLNHVIKFSVMFILQLVNTTIGSCTQLDFQGFPIPGHMTNRWVIYWQPRGVSQGGGQNRRHLKETLCQLLPYTLLKTAMHRALRARVSRLPLPRTMKDWHIVSVPKRQPKIATQVQPHWIANDYNAPDLTSTVVHPGVQCTLDWTKTNNIKSIN